MQCTEKCKSIVYIQGKKQSIETVPAETETVHLLDIDQLSEVYSRNEKIDCMEKTKEGYENNASPKQRILIQKRIQRNS